MHPKADVGGFGSLRGSLFEHVIHPPVHTPFPIIARKDSKSGAMRVASDSCRGINGMILTLHGLLRVSKANISSPPLVPIPMKSGTKFCTSFARLSSISCCAVQNIIRPGITGKSPSPPLLSVRKSQYVIGNFSPNTLSASTIDSAVPGGPGVHAPLVGWMILSAFIYEPVAMSDAAVANIDIWTGHQLLHLFLGLTAK